MTRAAVFVLEDETTLIFGVSSCVTQMTDRGLGQLLLALTMEQNRRTAKSRDFEQSYQSQNRCPNCQGTGMEQNTMGELFPLAPQAWECNRCDGDGKYSPWPLPKQLDLIPPKPKEYL